MAKSYIHKYPSEVYWQNREGVTRSQYFASDEKSQKAISLIEKHNAIMGHLFKPHYQIRDRIPISRKGAGKKKQ